ncbi:MAG TPA: DUF2630 family protein [Ktedonobacterales bacterium]|nr:DUF2630 family protein [Ktedonobacterales bacterium]
MNDPEILQRIDELVKEEHQLDQQAAASGGLNDEQRARLKALEVNLDQCWDLLRQRRARRNAGQNPDEAHTRPGETVEHYLA